MSDITELPLLISSYSPMLFGLLYPLLKIFGLQTIPEVVSLGRIFILFLFLLFLAIENFFFKKYFPKYYNLGIFLFSSLWFFVLFPGDILSLKPDFLAFLFEFLAFAYFYRAYFELPKKPIDFYLSPIFAGFAVAAKLNTLGVFFGIVTFLIAVRKFKGALLYSLVTTATVLCFFLIFSWQLGERFITGVLVSTKTIPPLGIDLVNQIVSLPQKVFYPYVLFYLLVAIGLWILFKDNVQKSLLFGSCLGASFLLATMGQVKVGAFLNYYFGFFTLALIPVSIAIKYLFQAERSSFLIRPLQIVLAFYILFNILQALLFPGAVFLNFLKNYPYEEARAYIQENYPDGYVYTAESDHPAPLHFLDRTLLGPWAETQLNIVPAFHHYIPVIREKLSRYRFSVAVKLGSGCENWRPSGIFFEETKHLEHLQKKIKKICIFSDR
ncbi:hypothetical protein [Pannus brasiliensis]|uniref:hypothetical protein n=1 Tax=Pannus brasiliensis TaxID=1579216 RepID=UPI002FCDAEBA